MDVGVLGVGVVILRSFVRSFVRSFDRLIIVIPIIINQFTPFII